MRVSRSPPMSQTSTGTTNTSFRDRENGGLSSSASSIRSVIRIRMFLLRVAVLLVLLVRCDRRMEGHLRG
jgi:hypothetical protein